MSPLNLELVHEYQRVPGTNQVRLVRTNPAVRLTAEGQPPVWIQDGVAYFDGGDRVPSPAPLWLLEEIKRMSAEVRQEVGLTEAVMKTLGGKRDGS